MTRLLPLLFVAVLTVVAPAAEAQTYDADNPATVAAEAEALRTLPVFLFRLDGPDHRRDDMLQVRMEGPDGFEDIWVEDLRRTEDGFAGTLNNQPFNLPGLQQGSRVEFEASQIKDWSYRKNGRRWGAFSARANLHQLNEADAARIRALLSDTPLESTAD